MIQPLAFADFYKTDHKSQYPKVTEIVYSNLTPRGSRIEGIDYIVVFGIQGFIKRYIIEEFNNGFFALPKAEVVAKYKRRIDNALGKGAVTLEHIEALHDLGYLPIEIKALPEGTRCPMRVPCLTISNTHKSFAWITNYLETLMSAELWHPMTTATIASAYRTLLDSYAKKTSDIPEFVDWQAHDFSMRGLEGIDAACKSGAAHLLSFTGTDTIPAIDYLEKYYHANSDTELIGGSVPATEHSVMCMGGKDGELNTFKRLLTETYPSGIVSVVSDSWDFWKVVTEYLPQLKNIIMERKGKLVIRPDSSPKTPVEIICGDPDSPIESTRKGAIECLWDIFGGTVNSKGYKQLDSHIGLIYGDSITLDRCRKICERLEAKGFASTNVVLGVGSFTYQHVTRDTFGFAMKATYGEVNGQSINIYKDPATDNGVKKSAKGLLKVTEDLQLLEEVTREEEKTGMLHPIFRNGVVEKEYSLSEIRQRLKTKKG
jgi:nicotinamide phosphoribosyltransferase